jgi:serine/threonine protein phosphatase PrpC
MPGSPTGRLYCGIDLDEGELHELGLGFAAVYTHRSPDSDTVNEDSCAIVPYDEQSGILVVADGAGGLPSGERASEIVVAALRSTVRKAAKAGGDLRTAVLDGIESASLKVAALGVGAGTTVAVAEISGSRLRTYHVGDSQIMVVGQKGKVKLTTKSHSPVGYAVEAGLIDRDEALTHRARHLVSNLVGMASMSIELGPPVELSPMDTLVVASDGLYDNLLEDEIADVCRKGQLLALARTLAAGCRERMLARQKPSKPDDLTFIAYRRRQTD